MNPVIAAVEDTADYIVPAGEGYRMIAIQSESAEEIRLSLTGGNPTANTGVILEPGKPLIITSDSNPRSHSGFKLGKNGIKAICATPGQSVSVEWETWED